MPAYLIAICRSVSDRQGLEDYWANVGPVEGVVLIEFPSMDAAKAWYTSAAYQEVKRYRQGAAEFELIIVDGGRTPPSERMPHTRV